MSRFLEMTDEPSAECPSPLPWRASTNTLHDWGTILAADGWPVATTGMQARLPQNYGRHECPPAVTANAHRIVACVNACAGIDDPAELRAQRDMLLAACRQFLKTWKHAGPQGSGQMEKFDVAVNMAGAAVKVADGVVTREELSPILLDRFDAAVKAKGA